MTRVRYIDIMKGIGILAMMWGHIMLQGWTNRLVYAFHMPLFFFVSGMLFHPERYENLKQFAGKRFRTLLIPYWIYSVVSWCAWAACVLLFRHPVESLFMPLAQTFLAQGSGGYLVHNAALWFVPCLFLVQMGYYGIHRLNAFARMLICFLCALAGGWMMQPGRNDLFTNLPWNMEVALAAMVFYAAGYFVMKSGTINRIHRYVEHEPLFAAGMAAVLMVITAAGSMHNGRVSMGHSLLGSNALAFYGLAASGISGILLISMLLGRKTKNSRLLEKIGRYSFDFMAVHVPVKGVIIVLAAKLLGITRKEVSGDMLLCAGILLLTLAVSSGMIYIVECVRRKTKTEQAEKHMGTVKKAA